MTANETQIWIGIIGSLVTIIVSVLGVLGFQRRRDRSAAVGANFKNVVDSLASDNATLQMAAAILLRRFFDASSEQGAARLAYAKEAVAVIAGLLRQAETGQLQKVLADGLWYAPCLSQADLQGCNLTDAYLGQKNEDKKKHRIRKKRDRKIVNLTNADFFKADLTRASLKGVNAAGAVFLEATLEGTVLSKAILTNADFRRAKLAGAKFDGAQIDGAQFFGAFDIPSDVASRLNTADNSVKATPRPQ